MDHAHCPHLPQPVLVQILQHVPLQSCLQRCALVNTAWAAAEAAATIDLTHCFPATAKAGHAKSVLKWLVKHGQETTSLQLLGHDKGLVLPFSRQLLPNLRCLTINDLAVSVGQSGTFFSSGAAAAAAAAAAAPAAAAGRDIPQVSVPLLLASQALTKLQLVDCRLLPQAQALLSLTVLTALTDLQHLKLAVKLRDGAQGCTGGRPSSEQQKVEQQVLAGMWPSLAKLKHLDLSEQACVSAAAVAGMTALTCLRDILFSNTMQLLRPASLAPLQQLTSLCLLQISTANMRFCSSRTPFLTSLPNLSHLALLDFEYFEPELLLSIPKLRSLQLQPMRSFGTVRELMLVLAKCTALTELRLGRLDVPYITVTDSADGPGPGSGPGGPVGPYRQVAQVDPEDFGAITASPVLQRLEIEASGIYAQSWQHILREELTQLRCLRLSNLQGALHTAGINLVVASCPNLTRLELENALRYDATLEGLVQLKRLEHLTVVSGSGDPPVDVLKLLTGLHSLRTGDDEHGMRWTATSLLELSTLRHLTRFEGRCRGQPSSVRKHGP